jgi:hypothetical protein
MDWVRAALRSNKKDNKGVHQVSIEELQEAIDATGAELARVREMGAQTRQRRANEILQLKRDRQVRDHDLIALASVAKRFTSLWEYARIVRTSFAEDQLGHTWFGWCEAWLLRLIHHAMMFKNQFTIVQKDCNGMLMDLYETIPKIKEEQNLGEAVALNNLCKQEISSRQSKQDHQEYVRLQRKIICKLKMRTAEKARETRRRRFSLPSSSNGQMAAEPTSFEQIARMAQEEAEAAKKAASESSKDLDDAAELATKATSAESSTDTEEPQKGLPAPTKRQNALDLSKVPNQSPRRERRKSLGDDSLMASSRDVSSIVDDNEEQRAARERAQKRIRERRAQTQGTSNIPSSPRPPRQAPSETTSNTRPVRTLTSPSNTQPSLPKRSSTNSFNIAGSRKEGGSMKASFSGSSRSSSAKSRSQVPVSPRSRKSGGPTMNVSVSRLDRRALTTALPSRRRSSSSNSNKKNSSSHNNSKTSMPRIPRLDRPERNPSEKTWGSTTTESSVSIAVLPTNSTDNSQQSCEIRSAMRSNMRQSLVKSASQRKVSLMDAGPSSSHYSRSNNKAGTTTPDRSSMTNKGARPTLKKSRSQRMKARQKAIDRLAESKRKSMELQKLEEAEIEEVEHEVRKSMFPPPTLDEEPPPAVIAAQ